MESKRVYVFFSWLKFGKEFSARLWNDMINELIKQGKLKKKDISKIIKLSILDDAGNIFLFWGCGVDKKTTRFLFVRFFFFK